MNVSLLVKGTPEMMRMDNVPQRAYCGFFSHLSGIVLFQFQEWYLWTCSFDFQINGNNCVDLMPYGNQCAELDHSNHYQVLLFYDITVIKWPLWRLKSPKNSNVCSTNYLRYNQWKHRARNIGRLWGKSKKGQWRGKRFRVMTSSWLVRWELLILPLN